MVDLWCASYPAPPNAVTLDMDDTLNVVHGHQQLSLLDADHDEAACCPPHLRYRHHLAVAVILRPGKTPSGKGFALIGALWSGASAARSTVIPACAAMPTRYKARSSRTERRACARIEATTLGVDIRFVVTSLATCSPEFVYDTLCSELGQAENLMKMHKSQLASDRTSCRSRACQPDAPDLHTAAYCLMLTAVTPSRKTDALAKGEFNTLRLRRLNSQPAGSKLPRASASPSRQLAPAQRSSAISPQPCCQPDREGRGHHRCTANLPISQTPNLDHKPAASEPPQRAMTSFIAGAAMSWRNRAHE